MFSQSANMPTCGNPEPLGPYTILGPLDPEGAGAAHEHVFIARANMLVMWVHAVSGDPAVAFTGTLDGAPLDLYRGADDLLSPLPEEACAVPEVLERLTELRRPFELGREQRLVLRSASLVRAVIAGYQRKTRDLGS